MEVPMSFRRITAAALASALVGAALGVVLPGRAQAEKLPVDCSGRNTACFDYRTCSWWVNHECWQWTTQYWYWYRT
jgi:hypothetical protein